MSISFNSTIGVKEEITLVAGQTLKVIVSKEGETDLIVSSYTLPENKEAIGSVNINLVQNEVSQESI